MRSDLLPRDYGFAFIGRWLAALLSQLRLLLPLAALLGLVLASVWAPWWHGVDPLVQNYDLTSAPPGPGHVLGTDALRRDLLARLLAGARLSLAIAAVALAISLGIGVPYGAVAGWRGGRLDTIMMRAIDVLYGIPATLVVILLMVYLEAGARNIYLAIGLTYWLGMARLVRGQVRQLKAREYVLAARALGASPLRLMLRTVLPNMAGIIIVAATLFIPDAIFTEAFLSYIGLGVPPPEASWGTLAAEGTRELRTAPHLLAAPALAICATMLAFNLVGEWLSDRFQRAEQR